MHSKQRQTLKCLAPDFHKGTFVCWRKDLFDEMQSFILAIHNTHIRLTDLKLATIFDKPSPARAKLCSSSS